MQPGQMHQAKGAVGNACACPTVPRAAHVAGLGRNARNADAVSPACPAWDLGLGLDLGRMCRFHEFCGPECPKSPAANSF